MRFGILMAIILLFCTTIACPVLAKESDSVVFFGRDRSLTKTIQSQITMTDLGRKLSLQKSHSVNQPNLMKEYDRLLRIARGLGTDFNMNIPLHSTTEHRYSITGVSNSRETWDNLTVGRTINLVSEAIYRLTSSSSSDISLNLLVKDMDSSIYYSLNDISLNQYCTLLLSR